MTLYQFLAVWAVAGWVMVILTPWSVLRRREVAVFLICAGGPLVWLVALAYWWFFGDN